MNPHMKPKIVAVQNTKKNMNMIGPHTVKSVFVVAAQTVMAITMAAVRVAASATING